jgi:transcriptional regulator with XRE-family HTH domain
MPVRTRVLADARTRARGLRINLGADVRSARLAAGLRLVDVGRATGRSATWVSRVERGLSPRVGLEQLVVLAAAVGVKVWATTYPAERAIRDAPQLQLLERFRGRTGTWWRWRFEVVVQVKGDRRAADAVMSRGATRVMVEAITRLHDAQAQLRAIRLKARDLGITRTVVVVAATHANRRALTAASDVVATEFPIGTRRTLAALTAGEDPGADGIVLL